MPERWPPPTYVVRASFRAPLDFVYRWCTDYTSKDAVYERDHYERRILSRTPRRVVYEDLERTPNGWIWYHHDVRLQPPARWHSDSVGSHRAFSLDYLLTAPSPDRTELTLTARRRPYGIGGKNPPRASWERSVSASWRNFARALERDFRASRRSRRAR